MFLEINIKNCSIKNERAIKDLICEDKLIKLLNLYGEYEIMAIDLINKSLYFKIKNLQNNIILRIVFTTKISGRKRLLNISGRIFIYYYSDYLDRKDLLLCKNIIKTIVKGAEHKSAQLNNIIELINKECIYDSELNQFWEEDSGDILQNNKDKILFLKEKITLDAIREKWMGIKYYEEINSFDQTHLRYKLIDKRNKNYFLKIFAGDNKYINNLLENSKFLVDKINIPQIIDYKTDSRIHWLLYEFLEEDYNKFDDAKRLELAVIEILRLHSLPAKIAENNRNKFNKVKNNYYLYKEEIIDRKILQQAISYFQENFSPKGFCHFDLAMRHFIYSGEKLYLVDIDSVNYD